MKKYRFGFDICGLVLFFLIMIPNFVWFVVPAPHDILRVESVTLVVDNIASIAQVVMVVGLCIFRNIGREKIRITNFIIVTTVCSLIYFLCWILYYLGITNVGVILGLTIFPCLAFLFYSFDRKNMFAFVPALIFMICHLVYAGVYQYKMGLINDEEENYLPLYIGESYSMLSRCSNHLYELFHNDPSYFGLTKEDLKDDKLQLIVDIYEKVSLEDNISNSDRDILLREKEIVAIEKLMPLSQNRTNYNLNKKRSAIVKEAIKELKSCNK